MALPFRLMIITDWALDDLVTRLTSIVSQVRGVAIQHRHPEADDRRFLEEARVLAELCERVNAPLFINRRFDVARLVGAHLHLPSTAVRAADVRTHLPGKWVSVAVHSPAEVQRDADLALVSPVFAPRSKPDDVRAPLGFAGFHALAAQTGCPAFALGGIDVDGVATLSNAAGVAVISGVLAATNPVEAAARIVKTLG